MKTIAAIIATVAVAGFTTASIAQARHDEKPHGYNAEVAAEQKANTTKVSTFATGPRPHDAVRRVAKAAPISERTVVPKPQEK